MSGHARKTLVLAAILVALLGLDFLGTQFSIADNKFMTLIPAVDLNEVRVLRIHRGEETMDFERNEEGTWSLTSPIQAPADRAAIHGILRYLDKGIELDILVEKDSDNLKSFGLEPGLLVQAYTDKDAPQTEFYVGMNTAGGASFLRFADSSDVYRGMIGGRHRYDRPASAWRNPQVLEISPDAVLTVQLNAQGTTTFQRNDPKSPWSMKEDSAFPVDQIELGRLAQGLAGLRAGGVLSADHPAGLDNPVAEVTVTGSGFSPQTLRFGRTLSGAFVQRAEGGPVYQIAPSFTERLTYPKPAWYNQQLFDFDRTSIHRMTLQEQVGGTTVLQQDPATNRWTVLQPPNVDANLRECMQAAIKLSELRAHAMSTADPKEAGFPSGNHIEITLLNGQSRRLELGGRVAGMPRGQEALFVRTADTPDRIAVISQRLILEIRAAFSR